MSWNVASPGVPTIGVKASGFGANYGRLSALAHLVTDGMRVGFFCFSATFREQKPAPLRLEAKRRAGSLRYADSAGTSIRFREGTGPFCTASKAIVHHRSNGMARVNVVESGLGLGCFPQM